MKHKKIISTLAVVGVLLSFGTTSFAADKANFAGAKSGNSYSVVMSNKMNNKRYFIVGLNGYDKNWQQTSTSANVKILSGKSGGNNAISLVKTIKADHVIGYGNLYNSDSVNSGVAERHSKTLK